MNHKIKIFKHEADAIVTGRKSIEMRLNNDDYKQGDSITYQVIDDISGNTIPHRIDGITYEIKQVWGYKGSAFGMVMFLIRPFSCINAMNGVSLSKWQNTEYIDPKTKEASNEQ